MKVFIAKNSFKTIIYVTWLCRILCSICLKVMKCVAGLKSATHVDFYD